MSILLECKHYLVTADEAAKVGVLGPVTSSNILEGLTPSHPNMENREQAANSKNKKNLCVLINMVTPF